MWLRDVVARLVHDDVLHTSHHHGPSDVCDVCLTLLYGGVARFVQLNFQAGLKHHALGENVSGDLVAVRAGCCRHMGPRTGAHLGKGAGEGVQGQRSKHDFRAERECSPRGHQRQERRVPEWRGVVSRPSRTVLPT